MLKSSSETPDWGDEPDVALTEPAESVAVVPERQPQKARRQRKPATSPDSPKTLSEALAAVRTAENMPEKTRGEAVAKAAALKSARAAAFRIQQGLPAVEMGANEIAAQSKMTRKITEQQRLELRARKDPDIRKLLAKK